MASTIKIKRSLASGQPGSLADGELAYSGLTGTLSNGGDRLYIGIGGVVTKVGGKFYTDLLEHTPGTLTAGSAIIVDDNKKINNLKIDKLDLSTNIVTTSDSSVNLVLDAAGTRKVQFYSGNDSYSLPRGRATDGWVLTTKADGTTEWREVAVNLTIASQNTTGLDHTINLLTDTLTINGASGITTSLNSDVFTISGVAATSSDLGVAKFDATDFTVTSGLVTLNPARIEDITGPMIAGGTKENITVTYNSSGKVMNFSVTTASTTTAGVAKFDSDFFEFTTPGDLYKVSLKPNVINSVTVGTTPLSITGNAITVSATSNTGISVSGSGSTITLSGIDASANVKGVAKFSAPYYTVTNGDVAIGTATAGIDTGGGAALAGLSRFNSQYFSVSASGLVASKNFTIGAQDINLGDAAVTQLTGMTLFEVGDLRLQNSTLSGTGTNTDVKLKPSGLGKVYIDSATAGDFWYLPTSRGTGNAPNEVLTIDKSTGEAYWQAPASNVTIYDNTGTVNQILTVGKDSLDIRGTRGIGTAVTSENSGGKVVVTISGAYATSNTVGVASFNGTEFSVTDGAVILATGGIDKSKLLQNTVQIGNTSVQLGSSQSNFAGLDSLEVANLSIGAIDGASTRARSTVTTLAQNSDLYVSGNGNGKVWISGAYALPRVDGLAGQSLITNGSGTVEWKTPTTVLKFQADESLDSTNVLGQVDLINDTLDFVGGLGIRTVINDNANTITIKATRAGYSGGGDSNLGVASFDNAFFTVSSGAVSIANNSIGVSQLATSKVTIGSTDVTLGTTVTTFEGLHGITTGNLNIGADTSTNAIVATNTNGGISLNTDGTGLVTIYGQDNAIKYTLPNTRGTNGYVLTTNGTGATTWAAPSTTLTISGDNGSQYDNGVNLLSEKLTIAGGTGINTVASPNTITVNADVATTNTRGIASFSDAQFQVNVGVVTLLDAGIQSIVGAMVGNGNSETNIDVSYNPGLGKLDFAVATASTSTVGVAKFYAGDFQVDSSSEVTLAPTVLKSIGTDNGPISPSNHTINIVGTSARGITVTQASGNPGTITVNADIATASTLGVAKFYGDGINIAGDGTVTLSLATDSTTKGIASFASANFTVTNGAVQTKTQKLGDQTINLGASDITQINGLTQATIAKVLISNTTDTTTISYVGNETDGNININPKGQGVIDVNGSNITGLPLIPPNNPTVAVSKSYADSLRSGITVKDPVQVATAPSSTNAHGVSTNGVVNLSYTGTDAPVIDEYTLMSGDRVLIKNQEQVGNEDSTDSVENGIWVWTLGMSSSSWARATDVNQISEMVAGMFTFVQGGATWADCGWVLQTQQPPGATIWTSGAHGSYTSWKFLQFSSAGVLTVSPSGGIQKNGQILSVNVANGIEISANNVQLASSVAGAGLTYTGGVLDVVGTTDRITVNANSIDISAAYVGQTSITTLGTIATGTWNGTAIAVNKGGTGLTTYNKGSILVGNSSNGLTALAKGAAGKFLQVNAAGDDIEYGDIDGGTY